MILTGGIATRLGKPSVSKPTPPPKAAGNADDEAAAAMLLAASFDVGAQDLLVRNATVHTATAQGTLQGADVLVRNGRIAAIGNGLDAAGVQVVEAEGRPLTPKASTAPWLMM